MFQLILGIFLCIFRLLIAGADPFQVFEHGNPPKCAHDGMVIIISRFSFIHSFKDLYSTSSRKLLRGAPDSSTVKKNSFQLIIECV